MLTLREIAHIRSDFPEKFGIPRQSGLVSELISTVVFEPEYRVPEALRGLEMYTHVWLVWEFSKAEEIPAWAFSRRVRRFVRIHWVLAA